MGQWAFALQVGQAFRIKSESERSGTLHRLVAAVTNSIAGSGVEHNDRLVARYGLIYRRLRERAASRALSEIDLAVYAKSGHLEQAASCLALMFEFPIELAESAICRDDPGFLLLACRSRSFAWSTVNALLALTAAHVQDSLFMMQCCEDYHALSGADAQRFMRLLQVNLQTRVSSQDQAGAELRRNVR